MSLPFFYHAFSSDLAIDLDVDTIHYMYHVLRMRSGEECWITNGKGVKCKARIASLSKRECSLTVLEKVEDTSNQSSLHLAIAFTKNPSRIEWLLEKATEIGIGQITPLITHRSEKLHWKKERFEKIIVSAMLQSQQSFLPILNEATSLHDIVHQDYPVKVIAWCDDHEEKIHLSSLMQNDKKTIILIGPEGDFTKEEVDLCFAQGFQPVSLGPHRLRTETAGLYAVVAYNASV